MAVRVALADDSFLVRQALAGLLAGLPGVELVAACRNADELGAAGAGTSPDIVLSDRPSAPSVPDEVPRLAAVARHIPPSFETLEVRSPPDVTRGVRAVLLSLTTAGATGAR